MKNKQVTIKQIAKSIPLNVEFTTENLLDRLSLNGIEMCDGTLGQRIREFVNVGCVERVRFDKCVVYRVSDAQYKLLIDFGNKKIENKKEAAAKRYPNPIRKRIAKRVKCENERKWESKVRMIGVPGETVSMRGV